MRWRQGALQGWHTARVVSHSAAISACEKGKRWGEALRLLQEMLHRSLAPGVVSHSAAISACEEGTHLSLTLILLRRRPPISLAPCAAIHTPPIHECSQV